MTKLLRSPVNFIGMWIFLFAFLVHFTAIYSQSGPRFLTLPILYGAAAIAAFFVFSTLFTNTFDGVRHRIEEAAPIIYYPQFLLFIDIVVIFFPIYYYTSAGTVPFLDMIASNDYYYKSGVRNEFYQNLNVINKYVGEYYMRGIAPFWLAYSLASRRKSFWLMLASTSIFALFLVTKSIVVLMILPSIVVCAFLRRWYMGAVLIAVVVAMLAINVIAPHLNTSGDLMLPVPSEEAIGVPGGAGGGDAGTGFVEREILNKVVIVIEALKLRLFDAHGLTAVQWFEFYQDPAARENGCGYRYIALFIGCDYVNIPHKIWLHYYPELAQKGMFGTATASAYLNAYANFGPVGIVLSGLCMGLLLLVVSRILRDPIAMFAFGAPSLLLTFESDLTTILHTGGLAILLALTVMYWKSGPEAAHRVKLGSAFARS